MIQRNIPSFRDKVKEILSASRYIINLSPDQLISFENNVNLHQFTEWLTLNIAEENCLTPEEIEEYQKLKENGHILVGEDLDEALQEYYEGPGECDLALNNLLSMDKQEELVNIEEQLTLKERLNSVVRKSVSSLDDDISELHEYVRKSKQNQDRALNQLNKKVIKYCSQLDQMKTTLQMIDDNISALEQSYETSTNKNSGTIGSNYENITDQLDTSMISTTSTSSLLSSCKYTGLNSRFLCQLPFDKYYKHHKHFCRIFDTVVHDKIAKLIELSVNTKVDFALEVQCLLDRLVLQKKLLLSNEAKIEGIKAAQKTIEEILLEIRCKTFKPDEFVISHLYESSFDDSNCFQNMDGLDVDEVCEQWKLWKCKQIKQHQRIEMSAVSSLINMKLKNCIEILKIKQSADTVLHHILYTEEGKVEKIISIYDSAYNNVKTKVNEIKERLKIINENIEDHAEFCMQPIQERSALFECLANALSSDKLNISEALNHLKSQYHSKHENMVVKHEQEIQQLIKHGQQLKATHRHFIEERVRPQNVNTLSLFENIQEDLHNINDEIHDAILHCKTLNNNEDYPDENNEVEQMLQRILENGFNQ